MFVAFYLVLFAIAVRLVRQAAVVGRLATLFVAHTLPGQVGDLRLYLHQLGVKCRVRSRLSLELNLRVQQLLLANVQR